MTTTKETTAKTIAQSCLRNFLVISPQQLTNLYNDVNDLIEIYNEKNKYAAEIEKLKNLFFNPIPYLKNKYKDSFHLPPKIIDWDVASIEWVYFRSIRFPTKLGKEFIVDTKKISESKTLLLADILRIHALFKREIRSIFNKVLIKEELELTFDFSKFGGVDIDGKDRIDIGIGNS